MRRARGRGTRVFSKPGRLRMPGFPKLPTRTRSWLARAWRRNKDRRKSNFSERRQTPVLSLSALAQLVHIFDGRLEDQGLCAAAHLEGVAVVPLDLALDQFSVFEHNDHRRL